MKFLKDVRYSLRVLRKSPGFAIAAVVTLALGIGANAVVFSVMNALILRSLDLPEVDSLYSVERLSDYSGRLSYPDYLDMRDRNRSFEELAAYTLAQAGLDMGDNPSRVWVVEASGNYFDMLKIQPYVGRFFHSSDEHGPNSAPYIVLSYSYWHSHFQDDRSAVGRVVQVNKHPFTIVGVAPPKFHGTLLFFTPDFFMPMINQEQVEGISSLNARGTRWVFTSMGHLKPGVTSTQAGADIDSVWSYLEETYPQDHAPMHFALARPSLYGDSFGRPLKAFLGALMLLAGLILLAACANLGSLFAARAADRSREVALRLALGAGRIIILRQFFTEAILISLMGGTLGILGSIALLQRLSLWQPFPQFPLNVPVNPDAKVYGVALMLTLVCGFFFGAVPIRQVLRTDAYEVIKAGTGDTRRKRIGLRDALLGIQIAICAVLVTSSMVAVRGLERSLHSNFGFEPQNVLLVDTILDMAGYRGDSVQTMQKRMISEMETIPGVTSVGLVDWPPLTGNTKGTLVFKDETTDLRPPNAAATALIFKVSPDYLRASNTALLSGRGNSWHDDTNAPLIAVVNREFTRKLFPSEGIALGGYFKMQTGARVQVAGIVEDGKYLNLTENPQAAMFLPILQQPSSESWLVVRSNRDPQQLTADIKNKLHELDPALPCFIETWNRGLDLALFPSRVATVALSVLGAMGVILSVTGIFGMAAYMVSRRVRDLGLRIALGAQPRQVLEAALGRAIRILGVGSTVGLLLGILASRVLGSIVYQATPRDPLVLGGVILAMSLLGLVATWVPAQRALAIDPLVLLREQ